MPALTREDHFIQDEEQIRLEQTRLKVLLQITDDHKKEVQGLQSQLENAERKASKLDSQVKVLDNELKTHRAFNPDRMKKQIKRLQEQNRTMSIENNTLKAKQKQLQQQLQNSKLELERLCNEKDEAKEETKAKKKTDVKKKNDAKEKADTKKKVDAKKGKTDTTKKAEIKKKTEVKEAVTEA